MRKLPVFFLLCLLLGTMMTTPKEAKAADTKWWVKSISGATASAVAIADNGDIIVAGKTGDFGNLESDIWVLRLDEKGDVKWQRSYEINHMEQATAVATAPNGDIIVVGLTKNIFANSEDILVLRLDENGNVKWQKTCGGSYRDWAGAVAIADNGDIVVAGGTIDAWVLRLDENGNVKWRKTYGGDYDDQANAVALTDNGDIVVAGYTKSFGAGGKDVWVLRLDSQGNIIWQKTYGGSEYDEANAVALAGNGDIIVAGHTESFGAGGYDVWVLRLNGNGNVKWQKTYGGLADDGANAVALAPNGDVIVSGNGLMMLSSDGNPKWAVALAGSDIKVLPDGTAALAGGTSIARFHVDEVPSYSGWEGWSKTNPEVHETNVEAMGANAKVHEANLKGQDTNAKIHETNAEIETLWTYTHSEPTTTTTTTTTTASTTTGSQEQPTTSEGGEGGGGGICGPGAFIGLVLLAGAVSRSRKRG